MKKNTVSCVFSLADCKTPPDLENGTFSVMDDTLDGNVANYSCNASYEFPNGQHQLELTCGSDGEWSSDPNFDCKGEC